MRMRMIATMLVLSAAGQATAQTAQAAPALAAKPTMPGPVAARYGPPIALEAARRAAAEAEAEAQRQNVTAAIAIVDPAGDLVWFERMDETQSGSIGLAQRKAQTSALYRRNTMDYLEALRAGNLGALTLGVVASPGGLPIVSNGAVIGAIGVSGGIGLQDSDIAKAGAAAAR